jgi:hypothetical protein
MPDRRRERLLLHASRLAGRQDEPAAAGSPRCDPLVILAKYGCAVTTSRSHPTIAARRFPAIGWSLPPVISLAERRPTGRFEILDNVCLERFERRRGREFVTQSRSARTADRQIGFVRTQYQHTFIIADEEPRRWNEHAESDPVVMEVDRRPGSASWKAGASGAINWRGTRSIAEELKGQRPRCPLCTSEAQPFSNHGACTRRVSAQADGARIAPSGFRQLRRQDDSSFRRARQRTARDPGEVSPLWVHRDPHTDRAVVPRARIPDL